MLGERVKMMLRYEVPVDDELHEFELKGQPVAVGLKARDIVEFWVESNDENPPAKWELQVFGTGQYVPPRWVYVGTAPRSPGGAVWHLFWKPAG